MGRPVPRTKEVSGAGPYRLRSMLGTALLADNLGVDCVRCVARVDCDLVGWKGRTDDVGASVRGGSPPTVASPGSLVRVVTPSALHGVWPCP